MPWYTSPKPDLPERDRPPDFTPDARELRHHAGLRRNVVSHSDSAHHRAVSTVLRSITPLESRRDRHDKTTLLIEVFI
ncbi:MAG TPA: hypothetical protein V6D02_09160 [Candidatus Obscuribacterales bacterium]